MKSKDLREEFILDTVSLCAHADIPLHKVDKLRPFLQKYCKQAGSLPQLSTLRKLYVPRLFELHYAALAEILKNQSLSITADEKTDVRDYSILNVLATVQGRPYLIGVSRMEACNHSTFSQGIIRSVTDVGIQ